MIAHGDYCDKANYVTKWIDFSNDSDSLCKFVRDVKPTGGGDFPECYELVLYQVRRPLYMYVKENTDSNQGSFFVGKFRLCYINKHIIYHFGGHVKNQWYQDRYVTSDAHTSQCIDILY